MPWPMGVFAQPSGYGVVERSGHLRALTSLAGAGSTSMLISESAEARFFTPNDERHCNKADARFRYCFNREL